MNALRTSHSLAGLLTLVALLVVFRVEVREWLEGTDYSLSLILIILCAAGLMTGLTSAMTAMILEWAAVVLLVLAVFERGLSLALGLAGVGLASMLALDAVAIRIQRSED